MIRRGFTLIEILVVLVITALLSGMVLVKVVPRLRAANLADAVRRIGEVDHLARDRAQQAGARLELRFNRIDSTITYVEGTVSHAVTRIAPCKIAHLKTCDGARLTDEVAIAVTPHGFSESYAVEISGQDRSRWLFFSGLTGQMLELEREGEVDELFSTLREPAPRSARDDTR